jgi:fatty-acid desaturase
VALTNISRNEAQCGGHRSAKMPQLHKVLQYALALLACAAINAAQITVCHHRCLVARSDDSGRFEAGKHIDLTPAAARAIGLTDSDDVLLNQ